MVAVVAAQMVRGLVFEKGGGFSSHEGGAFNGGVETGTTQALDTQKVPPTVLVSHFAIVANNGHDAGHFGRYRLEGNAHGHGRPGGGHLFVRFGRLFANRTTRVERGEFPKAMPMNGVATGHFVAGRPRRKQILLTNRTIGHVLAGLAVVILKQESVNAHATIVTMPEIVPPSHPTETTIVTMVGILVGRHPQIANRAMILSKLRPA